MLLQVLRPRSPVLPSSVYWTPVVMRFAATTLMCQACHKKYQELRSLPGWYSSCIERNGWREMNRIIWGLRERTEILFSGLMVVLLNLSTINRKSWKDPNGKFVVHGAHMWALPVTFNVVYTLPRWTVEDVMEMIKTRHKCLLILRDYDFSEQIHYPLLECLPVTWITEKLSWNWSWVAIMNTLILSTCSHSQFKKRWKYP